MKTGGNMDQPKILIVDDDPDIVETVRFRLEQEGYEVITANNGWEALGAVHASEPDLVVLDVMMPKENRYQVARMIKEDQKEGWRSRKTRVILLTARNLKDDPEQKNLYRSFTDADDVMDKPFEMDILIERIHEILTCTMKPTDS